MDEELIIFIQSIDKETVTKVLNDLIVFFNKELEHTDFERVLPLTDCNGNFIGHFHFTERATTCPKLF